MTEKGKIHQTTRNITDKKKRKVILEVIKIIVTALIHIGIKMLKSFVHSIGVTVIFAVVYQNGWISTVFGHGKVSESDFWNTQSFVYGFWLACLFLKWGWTGVVSENKIQSV